MLIIGWFFMVIAVCATKALIDDVKDEIEYNNKIGEYNNCPTIYKGENNGLQESYNREDRVVLRRCC